jgi:hypothetical protein
VFVDSFIDHQLDYFGMMVKTGFFSIDNRLVGEMPDGQGKDDSGQKYTQGCDEIRAGFARAFFR